MGDTILGHLVDNDAYASERMRCADVQSFLVAGHDTTGYTLAWLLCELARCPERAARLRDDLARSQPAEAAPYLGACVHETLRLWSVGAMGSSYARPSSPSSSPFATVRASLAAPFVICPTLRSTAWRISLRPMSGAPSVGSTPRASCARRRGCCRGALLARPAQLRRAGARHG